MLTPVLTVVASASAGLLAQQEPPSERPAGGGMMEMFILLAVVMLIFYFVLFRDQRRKQKQRREMLASLKKGDRVMTIGGVVGTAVAVKENEVVVKVDEASNTKITFARSAIDRVLSERQADQGAA